MATPKRPRDTNQLAKNIVDLSMGEASEPEMSSKAKAGPKGGLKVERHELKSSRLTNEKTLPRKPLKLVFKTSLRIYLVVKIIILT